MGGIFINIGIDIGGKHLGMGIVDDQGNIIKKEIIDYEREMVQLEDIFDPINSFISENISGEIESIGIGVPGISNDTLINYTCNLPLRDVEIRDYIKTHLPIYVSNDANCATIAEYQVVDGRLFSNYALVTYGTGIGAGIIINGLLYNGTTGAAGEIGHMVIDKEGIPCKCGRRGCYEKYASVSALKRMAELDDIKEIFYLSERNEVIQRVLDYYLENVAEGLANLINMYDVEMLVIGGSLAEYGDKFMPKLKAMVSNKIYNRYTYDLNMKIAMLKNDAGIIGAALLDQYM